MPYCPYLGVDLDEPLTLEHIVPRAIGGPDSFSILVSRKANSEAGRLIDGPLVNSDFIADERIRLKLFSADGTLPRFNIVGTADLHGEQLPARLQYDVLTGEGSYEILKQRVEIEAVAANEYKITFRCDPANAEALLRKKLDRLEILFTEEQIANLLSRIPDSEPMHVPMKANMAIDTTAFDRCVVKMCLGTGTRLFGESFANSADAGLFRRFMWEPEASKRKEIPLACCAWPRVEPRPYLCVSDQHLLAFLHDQSEVLFYICLFGKYAGCLKLGDSADNFIWPDEDGMVWIIEPVSRRLEEIGFQRYIASQAGKPRRRAK